MDNLLFFLLVMLMPTNAFALSCRQPPCLIGIQCKNGTCSLADFSLVNMFTGEQCNSIGVLKEDVYLAPQIQAQMLSFAEAKGLEGIYAVEIGSEYLQLDSARLLDPSAQANLQRYLERVLPHRLQKMSNISDFNQLKAKWRDEARQARIRRYLMYVVEGGIALLLVLIPILTRAISTRKILYVVATAFSVLSCSLYGVLLLQELGLFKTIGALCIVLMISGSVYNLLHIRKIP